MTNEEAISKIVDEILVKERTLTDEPISIPIVLKCELPKRVMPKMSWDEAFLTALRIFLERMSDRHDPEITVKHILTALGFEKEATK